jgi:hypothetical protein
MHSRLQYIPSPSPLVTVGRISAPLPSRSPRRGVIDLPPPREAPGSAERSRHETLRDEVPLAEVRAGDPLGEHRDAHRKRFRAAVYASAEALPAPGLLEEELPMVTAEPVAWLDEYRCFVLGARRGPDRGARVGGGGGQPRLVLGAVRV